MGKINLLSSKVFNRIAAGEVIERPFSVVKELVENSIDANAAKIRIEITDGGLSKITVSDDGSGIAKDDLKSALLPHATSKISKVEDLDQIKTLGFRGEALASIASVSKITVTSKTEEEEIGGKIHCEGGIIENAEDYAAVKGTEITVRNLFFNTPVRAKFLRPVKSEENEIYSTVSRFILGNPEVSFTLVADGKILLQSFGDGIESAFLAVYGVEVIKNCFYIDSEKNGIKINGYIGKHNFTKPNRTFQTVFLNKRYVLNQTVSSAIANAYASYLMKRQYPFYFLNITMPPEAVDVNVHPNKTDVRFINNQIVYGALYSTVSKVLDGSSEALDIVNSDASEKLVKPEENIKETPINYDTHIIPETYVAPFTAPLTFSDSSFKKGHDISDEIYLENKRYIEELERKRANEKSVLSVVQSQMAIEKDLRVIGQALNTFLILEDGEDLYFIDQHAAHERLLFDKITASYNDGTVIEQPLIIPYVLSVSPDEGEFLEAKKDFFVKIGFNIENFGRNSFKVSSVPAFLTDMDVKKFFDDVLSDVNTLKALSLNDILFEELAQKACKSAIKSGDKLSDNEIDALLKALKGNMGLKCPHGRPVAVKISRTEIDKWFKRIV